MTERPLWYEQNFRPVNLELKKLLGEWYDYRDRGYTSIPDKLSRRLDSLHNRLGKILDEIKSDFPEGQNYFKELEQACNNVINTSNPEYLGGMKVRSYHVILMDLHSVMLEKFGIERIHEDEY